MKKNLIVYFIALIIALASSGCKKNQPTITNKPVDGIPLAFDEGVDYFAASPSAVTDGDSIYLYYTTNITAGKTDYCIAVKKGEKKDGKWSFGERKIVLTPSASGWDAGSVRDADVVKGAFAYNGKTYSYLMAYQACADKSEKNHSIGVAVSNSPDGEFIKISTPVVAYDAASMGYAWGAGQPSLVSYDKKGKAYLVFTVGETRMTASYIADMDFSDLSDIKGAENASMLPTDGLSDATTSEIMLNDIGAAIYGGRLYISRDFNPVASAAPKTSTAVQIASVAISDIYTENARWTIIEERVNYLDLASEGTNGWERVYAGSVVKNFYGETDASTNVPICATVTSFDRDTREYFFFQGILFYDVAIKN